MRISDWSSDVCSSDLSRRPRSRPSRRSRRRSRCALPVGGATPRRSPRTRTPWLVAPSGDARQQCLDARIVVQRVEVAVVFHPCTFAPAPPPGLFPPLPPAPPVLLPAADPARVVEHH